MVNEVEKKNTVSYIMWIYGYISIPFSRRIVVTIAVLFSPEFLTRKFGQLLYQHRQTNTHREPVVLPLCSLAWCRILESHAAFVYLVRYYCASDCGRDAIALPLVIK